MRKQFIKSVKNILRADEKTVLMLGDIGVFGLIGGQRTISGSPVGSPETIAKMLDFSERHNIKPVVETFAFSDVNKAIQHLRDGKAHYRVVLRR